MTDAGFHQAPEGISARAIWVVAVGVVAISAALVAIAWLLVVPPPAAARPVAAPSPLEHGLIDEAGGGAALRAAGDQLLDQYQWVDRKAGLVRIPIDRAIDAVVADPQLITTLRTGSAGAAGSTAAPALSRAMSGSAAAALPAEVQR